MGIYSSLYYSLCETRRQLKESWGPGSNLHQHHILPKHMGGNDDDQNLTYLSVREHIVAHFLLWKMHRNPNDLRAMKMLGAKLSVQYRKMIGIYCRDNKIGFHGATKQQRIEWCEKGLQTQKESEKKNTFYWWSTEEGRKKRASMGGKIGGKKQKELKLGWHQEHIQRKAASLGGKAHKGKKCMHRPGDETYKRVRPENFQEYLELGYIFGSPLKPNKKKIF